MKCLCAEKRESYDKTDDIGHLHVEDKLKTIEFEVWIVLDRRSQW